MYPGSRPSSAATLVAVGASWWATSWITRASVSV